MHSNFKFKALSALIALLIFASTVFSIMPLSIVAEEVQPLKPGMYENFAREKYETGKTGFGGVFSNINDFISVTPTYFGSYIKQIDKHWSSDRATFPYGLYDNKNIDRYITYAVRDNTYFAFNTITATNYTFGALDSLIYNTNGTGWHLEVSFDGGRSFENLPYDNIFQAGAYEWTGANSRPTAVANFNLLDYMAANASTPNDRIPVPERDRYCLITHVHKIPAYATHVRIFFPKASLVNQYDSETSQQHAGLWSQSLSSIKLSRSKISSTSKGDAVKRNFYDDPEYSVKDSFKDSVSFSKGNVYIDDTRISNFTVANIATAFETKMSKVQFYTLNDVLITDGSTVVTEDMKIKIIADGFSGTVAGFNVGDVINEYKIIISELKEPEFNFKGHEAFTFNSNKITIKLKADEPDFTYEDFKNCYEVSYGNILFYQPDGVTPITDLSVNMAPSVIAKFVTKDCPGQLDNVLKFTYNISVELHPIYLTYPKKGTDSKLVLKPGVVDRFNLITDPNSNIAFSPYATIENSSAILLSPLADDFISWVDSTKDVLGKQIHTIVEYNNQGAFGVDPALIYKVLPETYISTIFLVGSNFTTAKDTLDSINDVKFYISADGDDWTEVSEEIYKGCIASTVPSYIGNIKSHLEYSYNDGKGENNFGGWSQVLFSAYVPEGYKYVKIKMPNTNYQKEILGKYKFNDPANNDYSLDTSTLYTFCSQHVQWDSGHPDHSPVPAGGGAITSSEDLGVFNRGFVLTAVKSSADPVTFDMNTLVFDPGDEEYVNDYDASEFFITNNKYNISDDIFTVRHLSKDEVTTYQDIIDSITLRFACVKFYTDSSKSTEITDLTKKIADGAYISIEAKGNKITKYYPDGKELDFYKISPIYVTKVPTLVENGDLYVVDHENKNVSIYYYMDEGAPTYATILNMLKGDAAQFRFETLAGGFVDLNTESASNFANLLICAYKCNGFKDGDVYVSYSLSLEPVLKPITITSLDTSKIEIDDNNNTLLIHSDSFTISDIDKLLEKNNCTLLFSMLQADGSFETILDYSILANTDVYVDLFSTIDSRTYSYSLTFDKSIQEEDTIKLLTVPDIETLSIDDFSAVVALITEYNNYYYQYDESQRAYYEGAIELLKTKMDNLFVTQQIAELTAGLPATLTAANVNTVLLIEKSYASLFSDIRDSLDSELVAQITNFKEQVGSIIQSDNGVKVSGLKWNIRIKVKGLSTKDEAFARVNPKVSGTNLLSLFEIEFYDILNNQPFVLEEDKVITVSLPVKDLDGYENLLGLYERTDGKISYLQSTLDGDYISFKVKAFNSVGIVGSEPFPVLIVVLASVGGLIVLAGIAVGIIFLVKNKNKVKGGTEE